MPRDLGREERNKQVDAQQKHTPKITCGGQDPDSRTRRRRE